MGSQTLVREIIMHDELEIPTFDFTLPRALEAGNPPEARGLARDQVRLMVSYREKETITHTQFRDIGSFLRPGDLLVVNTSGTMNAALTATRSNEDVVELHLSTLLPNNQWVVEVRQPNGTATEPFYYASAGETLRLPRGGSATLIAPYHPESRLGQQGKTRLWIASLELPCVVSEYLTRYGFAIHYNYVTERWPIQYYQTVFATETGSAEMPSAGRAFTPELVTQLISHGVQIAPLLLHTGVASLEAHEPPYEEFYRVPKETARLVNATRAAGKRVIAVGTTVVRALETVTNAEGVTSEGTGWTDVIITPDRGVRAVNGLLTGLHEPQATHLAMLEAFADRSHLTTAYDAALREGYLWHEFGDLHLILPF